MPALFTIVQADDDEVLPDAMRQQDMDHLMPSQHLKAVGMNSEVDCHYTADDKGPVSATVANDPGIVMTAPDIENPASNGVSTLEVGPPSAFTVDVLDVVSPPTIDNLASNSVSTLDDSPPFDFLLIFLMKLTRLVL